MTQLISNVLMQPKPDAVERPLTLIEKLEQKIESLENYFKQSPIVNDEIATVHASIVAGLKMAIAIVKQHQAESGWVSVNERLPERVKLCFILAKSDTRGLCYHLGVCIDDIWFDYLDRKIQDTAIFWQYANIPQPPSEVKGDM